MTTTTLLSVMSNHTVAAKVEAGRVLVQAYRTEYHDDGSMTDIDDWYDATDWTLDRVLAFLRY